MMAQSSSHPLQIWEKWEMGLFWGWNAVFLAIMLLGFAPLQLPQIVQGVLSGDTPLIYLVLSLVLTAIPLAAVLLGLLVLRKDAHRLFALAYVVEWPVLLILLFRYTLIRQGNLAITVLLGWTAVAEVTFLWHLFDRRLDERRPFWIGLRLAGLTLLFVGSLYAAVWLAFYVPILFAGFFEMVKNIGQTFGDAFQFFQWSQWYDLPLSILGYTLVLFSVLLILVMPVVGPMLAIRAWLHSLRKAIKTSGPMLSVAAMLVPLVLLFSILGFSLVQPQQAAFKLLETPPSTPAQAHVLAQSMDKIRAGLLNAYLAPFRYMSSVGEVRHISNLYVSALHFSEPVAWRFEQAYEVVIRPLLYVPVHPVAENSPGNQSINVESQEAATLYQNFFDQPILQGERAQIIDAVKSSSNVSQAEQAREALDDREVHLNRQEVNLTEHGDWAEIEIHEVFENRTTTRQEVIYYFNLPESGVITGLWLGSKPDRSQAFAYQVAPRGAAQAVYRSEIRYNIDPALVEQIGPRQYRLRAFPIEPAIWMNGLNRLKYGPELYLWMTYRTVAVADAWPLPQLAEKRNVFWDSSTQYAVNSKPVQYSSTDWLPASIPAAHTVVPTSHRVDFPDGQTVLVQPSAGVKTPGLPVGLRLAVVIDRSFSMRGHVEDVQKALSNIRQLVAGGPGPDIYLTSSKYHGDAPVKVSLASLRPNQLFFFGGQNPDDLFAQFETLQKGSQYDAILVLTDNAGYELGASSARFMVPDAPMWLVHLGGGLPLGYDDPTLQAIQASGGGVASTVNEALSRFAAGQESPGQLDVVDGYVWRTLPTSQVAGRTGFIPTALGAAQDDVGIAALAARRLILAEMAQNHGSLDQLPILDQLNRLAVDQSIVTPYSSMIVLVSSRQQGKLDQLSAETDRYQREVENVGITNQPNPLAVTGVPEPDEWLLLVLAGLTLAYAGWRKLATK